MLQISSPVEAAVGSSLPMQEKAGVHSLDGVKQSTSRLWDTGTLGGSRTFQQTGPLGHCSHAGYSGPQLSQPPGLQKWTTVASPSRQEVQGSFSGNSDQPKKKVLKILTLELSQLNSPLRSRYSEDRIDRLHSSH